MVYQLNGQLLDAPEAFPGTRPAGLQIGVLVSNELLRQGLVAMLGAMPLVGEVSAWDPRALPDLTVRPPDMLILSCADLDTEAVVRVAGEASCRGTRVMVLLDRDESEALDAAAAIPGSAFLSQAELTSGSLEATLRRMDEGELPMPAALAGRLLARARGGTLDGPSAGRNLTPRELEVLECLVEGLSNKQIARRLRISQHGAKRHVSNILAKLNCPNRTLAVAVALTERIVEEKRN
jgi:two-component system nitrate/nitrite response regulator NarL